MPEAVTLRKHWDDCRWLRLVWMRREDTVVLVVPSSPAGGTVFVVGLDVRVASMSGGLGDDGAPAAL